MLVGTDVRNFFIIPKEDMFDARNRLSSERESDVYLGLAEQLYLSDRERAFEFYNLSRDFALMRASSTSGGTDAETMVTLFLAYDGLRRYGAPVEKEMLDYFRRANREYESMKGRGYLQDKLLQQRIEGMYNILNPRQK